MDIVTLKIAQSIIKGEDANVSAVMDMISAHDWIGVILHPDTRKRVPADFVVLIKTLSVVGDIKANILAVGNVATADYRFRTRTSYTNSCPYYKIEINR